MNSHPHILFARKRYPPPPPNNTPVSPFSTSPEGMGSPATPEEIVQCAWCLCDSYTSFTKDIDSHHVCHKCIREQFEKAVQSEDSFPIKWKSIELRPDDHQDILSSELVQQYKNKKKEYQTPAHKRIYCKGQVVQAPAADSGVRMTGDYVTFSRTFGVGLNTEACGTFIGAIKPLEDGVENAKEKNFKARCKECRTLHCLICGEAYVAGGHKCSGISPSNSAADEIPPDWVRGKDYQFCPSSFCERLVELIDGCNHCVCRCGQSFCFVCGEPAEGHGTHWVRGREEGGCPQFNHPSQPNANWGNALDDGLDEFVLERARVQPIQLQQRMMQEEQLRQAQRQLALRMLHTRQAQEMQMRQQQQQEALLWQREDMAEPRRNANAFDAQDPPLNPMAANYVPESENDTSTEGFLASGHAQERRNAIAGPAVPAPPYTRLWAGRGPSRRGPGGRVQRGTGPGASQTTDTRIRLNVPPELGVQDEVARQNARAMESQGPANHPLQIRASENMTGGWMPAPQDWDGQMGVPRSRVSPFLAAHDPEHDEFTREQLARISRNSGTGRRSVQRDLVHPPRAAIRAGRDREVLQQAVGQIGSGAPAQNAAIPHPIGFGAPIRNAQQPLQQRLLREISELLHNMAAQVERMGPLTTRAGITQQARGVLATIPSPEELDSAYSWVQEQLQDMSQTHRIDHVLLLRDAWVAALSQTQQARAGAQADVQMEDAGY